MTDKATLTALAEQPCKDCGGSGEIFGHTDDCQNEWCALACGLDDCAGKVEICPMCADTNRADGE